MECPNCGNELECHDYYGRICAHQDGKVIGDIYICPTCVESCADTVYYHVRRDDGVLREGYPC